MKRSVRRAPRRKRRSAWLWQGLNKVVVVLIWVGAAAFVVFSIYPEWRRLEAMENNLEREQQSLGEEELLRLKRAREVRLLESDPEYIELRARDKLDLMKEDETIFRVNPPKHPGEERESEPSMQ